MPVFAELRERINEGCQEIRARKDVKQGMETLLAGSARQIFDLPQPIYPGYAWNSPAHISIFRIPRGFDLTVRAGINGYGEKIVVVGNEVAIIEITRGEILALNLVIKGSPWYDARRLVNRVVMATSTDTAIQERYLRMRQEEQVAFERLYGSMPSKASG